MATNSRKKINHMNLLDCEMELNRMGELAKDSLRYRQVLERQHELNSRPWGFQQALFIVKKAEKMTATAFAAIAKPFGLGRNTAIKLYRQVVSSIQVPA